VAGVLNDNAAHRSIRPMSLLHIHGTADGVNPYNGGIPENDNWSAPKTIDFWVQSNGCASPPDTVLLADLDSADCTRVEKISFTSCAGGTETIHYRILGGGHTWPGSARMENFLDEGRKNNDINANVEIWKFLKEYRNPLMDLAFGKRIAVQRLYVSLEGDSLIVTGAIANPESHPVTVYALVEGVATAHSDSVALYDDGRHSDGEAGDNVYGAALMASRLVEDSYNVTLITYDDSLGIRYQLYRRALFTTTGPVLPPTSGAVTGVRYDELNRWQYFKLVLKNAGGRVSIGNLRAGVSCNDPRIGLMIPSTAFNDSIPAGVADSSDTELCFEYADGYGPDSMRAQPVIFTVVVSSGKYPFWTSTFTFSGLVTGSVGPDAENDLPMAFGLEQNYPNPFNPSTTIKFELPKSSEVMLSVYDMLGREVSVLVDEKKPAGVHEVQFDARNLASGVYVYRLTAGNFVRSKKLVLVR